MKKDPGGKAKNLRHDGVKRAQIGSLIKGLRENARLTQNEFAKLVGQEYFTMISQVETGRVRVPPADTELWARVLGVDPQAFAKECVRHYEVDEYFKAIYGKDTKPLI